MCMWHYKSINITCCEHTSDDFDSAFWCYFILIMAGLDVTIFCVVAGAVDDIVSSLSLDRDCSKRHENYVGKAQFGETTFSHCCAPGKEVLHDLNTTPPMLSASRDLGFFLSWRTSGLTVVHSG